MWNLLRTSRFVESAPGDTSRPIVRRSRLGAVLVLALPLLGASAKRHIELIGSTPKEGGHVMSPVREIRLSFDGPIDVSKASVQLRAADRSLVPLGAMAATDSNHVAVAKVNGTLKSGNYTVQWKAVAEDGADGSGAFTFMYMAPKAKK